MRYATVLGCVMSLCVAFISNANAASSSYSGTLNLTDYTYTVNYYGTAMPAAADMIRFDLGTGWSGQMDIVLDAGNFGGFSMLGMALTTDPNDALYSDPSTFLQLATSSDITGFFNDNVAGWVFYLWGNDFIPSGESTNITDHFSPMQFNPLEHYYAFVAGGAISPYGSNVDVGLTVSSVPVPAAVWLLASGIAGLIGIGRRKAYSV